MFDDVANKQKLTEITQLFGNVKSIIIYAEEIASDFDTYPQVLLELRNTLDHILRAVAAEINPTQFEKNYSTQSLDKAYSHLYRAAYDALDWTAIEIRESIIEELRGFSSKTISKAIPDYYPTMRKKIEQINREISEIRKSKDIASSLSNLQSFGKYLEYIETLRSYKQTIIDAKPSILELEGESKASSRRYWIGTAAITIVGVIIAAIITYFITKGQ